MFHLARLLQSHKTWRGDYAFRACILALGLACAFALYFLSPLNRRTAIAQTRTVVQNDFEDGALQGWIPRGPVTLTNTSEAAASSQSVTIIIERQQLRFATPASAQEVRLDFFNQSYERS